MQRQGMWGCVAARLRRAAAGALTLGVLAAAHPAAAQAPLGVASPDGRNRVSVEVREGGLYYSVSRDGRPILLPSRLGFVFRGGDSLYTGLRITGSSRASHDETWTQPWGE